MTEDTQHIQQQTSQTPHSTGTPQNPDSDIQSTLDQQSLEGTSGRIQLPGSSGQATTATTGQTTNEGSGNLLQGLDVGTGLLAASFFFAVTLLLLLAKFAKHPSPQQADISDDWASGDDTDPVATGRDNAAPAIATRPKKKLTRRQRRQQYNKRG